MLENPHIFLVKTGSYLAPGVQTLSDRRKAHQKWCAGCVFEFVFLMQSARLPSAAHRSNSF